VTEGTGQHSEYTGGYWPVVTVRLITNPQSDTDFQRRAEQLAEGVETPEELERLLRRSYARARVVTGVTDIVERWYVYRDGRWINSRER
jgi:hypothetical protein